MWSINRSADRHLMSGPITVTIGNTDDFFYPLHSWVLVEGKLAKAAELITLTNDANIKYSLGGMEKV